MDSRKLKILAAVVDEYIRTGEPVGSKVIAGKLDISVSPATIRNDMSVLEQLGYLEQPHTSAGRIPTYNGYRLYIDELMTTKALSEDERVMLDSYLDGVAPTEEALIETASRALAELTQCAAVVSDISPKYSVITKVEVIPTGRRMYVLLLITSNGSIKNKVCRLEFDLTDEQLHFFTEYMQENLSGVALEQLSEEMMEKLVMAMGTYMMTLTPLIQGVCELTQNLRELDVKISGERNLLSCKEMDQGEIIRFIEHKNEITKLLDESFSGIQVVFSEEEGFIIGNSSMIVSKYKKGGKTAGSLGVVGPMRIDYAKIIPYIEYFTEKITEIMSEDEEDSQ